MKQIMSEAVEEGAPIEEDIARARYRKSHNHYEPSEQVTRDYEEPFDKSARFGKVQRVHAMESRVKRILTWINHEPITLVNRRQADFVERTRAPVGQIKDPVALRFYAKIVHGKKDIKDEFGVSDALRDSDLNEEIVFWWQCLQDLSNFRQKLRKRVPEVPFLDIEDDLSCLDENYTEVLSEDKTLAILKKYHIYPNKEFFIPLMDMLQLRTDGSVYYRELLNLLNWRRKLPALPKTKQASLASSDYVTTYADSIGHIQTPDNAEIHAAGLSSERSDLAVFTTVPRTGICPDKENLGDQTSVRCLVSPSIFTRHGLTHLDFFKARNKEEMRSIFENAGFEFLNDNFDTFWQQGLQTDCTGGVCVETFRELLDAAGFVATKRRSSM